ncbi:tyrosine-type recombinase/integrase [Levilactobacillus humaensis]|uniref:tyrosine-type recombinase/integrase n=1 Tax=Levilactobacillus humaensis TaxID=2950375 RepID=UPI0021C3A52F|nr:site-specific integrase [Levilactobacillus humaensis]
MASFRKRGKTWQARVSYLVGGEKKEETKGGFEKKSLAIEWANGMENRKLSGKGLDRSNITLPDYFRQWYEAYKKPLVAASTKNRYEYAINLIEKEFAGQVMSKITRMQYQRFLNRYGKAHALASSKKVNTQIRAAVRSAMEDGIIPIDFTSHTSISGHASKDRRLKFLDVGQMQALIAYLKTDISAARPTKMMALVALFTGARFAEVAGLTWDDIAMDDGTISISKSWDTLAGNRFKPTKNKQSNRTITVSPELLAMLKVYHHSQKLMVLKYGIQNDKHLLFLTPTGQVPSSTAANKTLKHSLVAVGSKKIITFHGLRHTHASYLIYKDISIYFISERLGHANYNITMQIYSHIVKEKEELENTKMLDALSQIAN